MLDYGYSRHRNQNPQKESQDWTRPLQENLHVKNDKLSISTNFNDVPCLLNIFLVENILQIALYPFNIRTKHHRVPNHFLRAHVVKGIDKISFIWKESKLSLMFIAYIVSFHL